jgi:arylsulfatase A-like enzyme
MRWARRTTVFLAVAISCTGGRATQPSGPLSRRLERAPNILIILTDDERADGVAVMPKSRLWFADKGVHFVRAFASTPLCCPFRASLFSGKYAHNHGVRLNRESSNLDQDATIQSYLGEAGYFTGIAGKYLNNWPLERGPPHFDRWAFFSPSAVERGYYDVEFNVDGEERVIRRYSTSFIEDTAIDMLEGFEQEDRRPWLLYVTPFAAHEPYTTLPRYLDARVPAPVANPATGEQDVSDKPPFVRRAHVSSSASDRVRVAQLRSLMPVDDLVDRLLRRLRELGEERRTLAFFLSDGGYMWGEHGVVGKKLPYTQSVRIPFYMRWPGHLPERTTDRRLAVNVDIAPTVLDAAGVDAPEMDGRSLIDHSRRRRRVLIEHWRDLGPLGWPTWASLWTRRYQYVEYYGGDNETIEFREFYDLRADRWQTQNLLSDLNPHNDPHPELLARLSNRLAGDRRCVGAGCP